MKTTVGLQSLMIVLYLAITAVFCAGGLASVDLALLDPPRSTATAAPGGRSSRPLFLERRRRLAGDGIDLAKSLREDLAYLLNERDPDRRKE